LEALCGVQVLADRHQITHQWVMRQGGIFTPIRSRFAAALRWLADRADAVDPEPCDLDTVGIFQVLSLPPKSTKSAETKEECTGSLALTRSQSDWDDYAAFFLDWCIEHGHTGEHDTDEVLALTQSFDKFERTPAVHETPFFEALKRVGIEHEKIDMPRTHPRYGERKAGGCKRPRLRIYNLPIEMPDCFVPTNDAEPFPLAA
jgi:hypothetical protein